MKQWEASSVNLPGHASLLDVLQAIYEIECRGILSFLHCDLL